MNWIQEKIQGGFRGETWFLGFFFDSSRLQEEWKSWLMKIFMEILVWKEKSLVRIRCNWVVITLVIVNADNDDFSYNKLITSFS